jgi:hypothetical protein
MAINKPRVGYGQVVVIRADWGITLKLVMVVVYSKLFTGHLWDHFWKHLLINLLLLDIFGFKFAILVQEI